MGRSVQRHFDIEEKENLHPWHELDFFLIISYTMSTNRVTLNKSYTTHRGKKVEQHGYKLNDEHEHEVVRRVP